ncbi:ubiquitin domain-containing protein UBFD1-like isoform X1 [Vespa mandarinia]|uniref:ubiquitin domain-containing protein UBFD1-like isoform X1 n=2 Tax=Vespa mandarinia TaxID=7446 RepID=UPI00160E5190|nr:ubiquitin domain-containing protein UBFD1-like isoform X1 [Vespa mandarinia]XP_046830012.1 ubiquitin domain-containing protein UBFD1-like isoform X1 [Vespa crabro]XP_047360276.1 ubiquitin domain-containing protein UBFD1-like isoform X1 [Vespa velutina]
MEQVDFCTTKGDGNDKCCNSSPCPEIVANSMSDENVSEKTNVLRTDHENDSVQPIEDTAATTSQDIPQEKIDFKVIYNKQKININFALDGTVAELKAHLQNIISVPQVMQKVMFKGLAKDDQTLRNLGVTKGAKVMIVGSKLDDVLAVSIPSKQDLADEASSTASKEPLSQQKIHRKILDKGIPDDVMPGILDSKEPLPEFPISGMLNKFRGKVRLTFKLEQDQLWIGTKERTDKIPMNSIKGVHSEPIHDHPEYHIMGIQLGTTEASRYWIYWVPAQYISAIKDAILGKWCYF